MKMYDLKSDVQNNVLALEPLIFYKRGHSI
jgi:hypothetical protein